VDAAIARVTPPETGAEHPFAPSSSALRLPGDPDLWFFIVAELAMFGAFFVAYVVYRAAEVAIFDASQLELDRGLGALNTLLLLTSSWAFASAVAETRRNANARVPRYLAMALALGAAFVAVKGFEYFAKLSHGITITTNTFFMFYFALTGIHLLHVVGGMVMLSVVCIKARHGAYHAGNTRGLETAASYWHMVDLLWIFLFALLYLLRR
jgi:nitric oxide reductase NorE protein